MGYGAAHDLDAPPFAYISRCMCASKRGSFAQGVCGGGRRRARPEHAAVCILEELRARSKMRRLRREFAVGEGAAHDLDTLLYAFLDELLFCFLTDMFVCKALRVTRLKRGPAWTVSASGCAADPPLCSGFFALVSLQTLWPGSRRRTCLCGQDAARDARPGLGGQHGQVQKRAHPCAQGTRPHVKHTR